MCFTVGVDIKLESYLAINVRGGELRERERVCVCEV